MPEGTKRAPRVLALDADRLGQVAGALAALPVALAQMFYRDADPLTTIVRSGWTYVGTYAATFVMVRLFLRASLFQMLDDKRARREERRRKLKERQAEAKMGAATPLDTASTQSPHAAPPPPSESGLPQL